MRPSKRFFYLHFKADAAEVQGQALLDAASSKMKNYSFFPNVGTYYGVDQDRERLKEGKEKHPEAYAIRGDISRILEIFPERSIDAIVSTHTLEHMDRVEQHRWIENAIRLLKPEGVLIFNRHKKKGFKAIDRIVKGTFEKVKRVDYCSFLSRWYERFRQDENGFYRSPKGKFGIKVQEGIFRSEAFFSKLPFLCSSAYFYCQGVDGKKESQPCHLSLEPDEDGIIEPLKAQSS